MPLSKTSVFDGTVIEIVRDMVWNSPRERMRRRAREQDKAARAARADRAEAAGDYLWYLANRPTTSGNTVLARKFIPKDEQARLAGDVAPGRLDTYHQDNVG